MNPFAPADRIRQQHTSAVAARQFLIDSDLADTSVRVITQDYQRLHKTLLKNQCTGQAELVLQINALEDVSQSLYSQLDKENTQTRQMVIEPTQEATQANNNTAAMPVMTNLSKRLLRLTLSDGHVEMPAMELRPIPELSIHTPIGTKLLIKNAMVQRGMVLLQPENVQVLGGRIKKFEHQDYQYRLRERLGIPHPPQTSLNNESGDVVADFDEDSFNIDEDALREIEELERRGTQTTAAQASHQDLLNDIIDLTWDPDDVL